MAQAPAYSAFDFAGLPPVDLRLEGLASDPPLTHDSRLWVRGGTAYINLNGTTYSIANKDLRNSQIAADAAIDESKLNLASDAEPTTASRRSLGLGATQAMPGNARLNQLAEPSADVSLGGRRIIALADPQQAGDAATMRWVSARLESLSTGKAWRGEVRVVSKVNVSISAPGAVHDGVTLAVGDRILLVGQSNATQNGIWVYNGATAALSRAADADSSAKVVPGLTVEVREGSDPKANWMLSNTGTITLGVTALTFLLIGHGGGGATIAAGDGLSLVGNVISIAVPIGIRHGGTGATTAAGARSNLEVPHRGMRIEVPEMTAGLTVTLGHGLGEVSAQVRQTADDQVATIDTRVTSSNVYLTAGRNVPSGTLYVIVNPIAG